MFGRMAAIKERGEREVAAWKRASGWVLDRVQQLAMLRDGRKRMS